MWSKSVVPGSVFVIASILFFIASGELHGGEREEDRPKRLELYSMFAMEGPWNYPDSWHPDDTDTARFKRAISSIERCRRISSWSVFYGGTLFLMGVVAENYAPDTAVDVVLSSVQSTSFVLFSFGGYQWIQCKRDLRLMKLLANDKGIDLESDE